MIKILLIIISFQVFLYSSQLHFENIQEINFYKNKEPYIINAKIYVKNFSKKKILKFFLNRKRFMLENSFYEEGYFQTKYVKLFFKKAYKINNKIYLISVRAKINQFSVKAQDAIVYPNYICFNKCEFISRKRIIRRKKYIFQIKNK